MIREQSAARSLARPPPVENRSNLRVFHISDRYTEAPDVVPGVVYLIAVAFVAVGTVSLLTYFIAAALARTATGARVATIAVLIWGVGVTLVMIKHHLTSTRGRSGRELRRQRLNGVLAHVAAHQRLPHRVIEGEILKAGRTLRRVIRTAQVPELWGQRLAMDPTEDAPLRAG